MLGFIGLEKTTLALDKVLKPLKFHLRKWSILQEIEHLQWSRKGQD